MGWQHCGSPAILLLFTLSLVTANAWASNSDHPVNKIYAHSLPETDYHQLLDGKKVESSDAVKEEGSGSSDVDGDENPLKLRLKRGDVDWSSLQGTWGKRTAASVSIPSLIS